jgi:hypothetical protein
MTVNPPFNLDHWVDRFRDQLKPPVGNKLLFEEDGMIAQIIGGPTPGSTFTMTRCRNFSIRSKAT